MGNMMHLVSDAASPLIAATGTCATSVGLLCATGVMRSLLCWVDSKSICCLLSESTHAACKKVLMLVSDGKL